MKQGANAHLAKQKTGSKLSEREDTGSECTPDKTQNTVNKLNARDETGSECTPENKCCVACGLDGLVSIDGGLTSSLDAQRHFFRKNDSCIGGRLRSDCLTIDS